MRRKAVADARYREWMKTAPADAVLLSGFARDMEDNLRRQSYSWLTLMWDRAPRRAPCEACGEESCENATWVRR